MNLFTLFAIGAKQNNGILTYASDEIIKQEVGNFETVGTLISDVPGYIGFSGNNYINITNTISEKFKAVFHIANFETTNNNVLIAINGSRDYWLGIKNHCLGREYSGTHYNPDAIFEDNKTYWFGIEWEEYRGNLVLYMLEDDGTYTIDTLPAFSEWDYSQSGSVTLSSLNFRLGYNPGYSGEYWRGSIDLTNSYIKGANDNYIFNGKTAVAGTDYTFYGNQVFVPPEDSLCGFSGNNYVKIPVKNHTTSFELVVKAHTPGDFNNYSIMQYNKNYNGIVYRINSSREARLWISNNGNSWNIMDNTGTGLYIPTNTDVWFRVKWDGSIYYIGYSTDGTNYTEYTLTNSNAPYFYNDTQSLGGDSIEDSTSWKGSIAIQDSYLKINNKLFWQGEFITLQPGDDIKINEGMGLSGYKWSAYNYATQNENTFTLTAKIKKIELDSTGHKLFKIKKPVIPTNKVIINTGELYDAYSDNSNDVYIKYGNIDVNNDYRYTNNGCLQGPGWCNFNSSNSIYITNVIPSFNSLKIYFKATSNDVGSHGALIERNDIEYDIGLRSNGKPSFYINGWIEGTTSLQNNTTYWWCVDYSDSANFKLYTIQDNNYILSTLPNLSNWIYQCSTTTNIFTGYNFYLGSDIHSSSEYWKGIIHECQIILDDSEWFKLSSAIQGTDYIINGNIYKLDNSTSYAGRSNKYILLNSIPNFSTANSWEFKLKFTYYSSDRSYKGIFAESESNDYQMPYFGIENNRFALWISSSGYNWNVLDGNNTGQSSLSPIEGYTYWFKVGFTGQYYYIEYKINYEDSYINILKVQSNEKTLCNSGLLFLNRGLNLNNYYSNSIIDMSESSIIVDNVEYKLGEANVINQFYEKTGEHSVSPITVSAKVNMDNNLIINNSIYLKDTTKDVIIKIDYDNIYQDTTDGNYNITLDSDQDNSNIVTSSELTSAKKVIDNSIYHKFDMDYLDGYNTKLIVSGKPYEPWELPLYFKNDMNFIIQMQRIGHPFEVYEKSLWFNSDWNYRKQTLTISIDQICDNINLYINGSCKWEYTNTNTVIIDLYKDDILSYEIIKDNYKTEKALYSVSYTHQNPTYTLNISMTRVYKYTFNVDQNDANIELTSSNTYAIGSNWIQVFSGASIKYKITKDNYEDVTGSYTNVNSDRTLNITMVNINVNNITGIINPLNVNNKDAIIYQDTNDHYIVSGEKSSINLSNYPYITEIPLLPLDTAKSWEIRTAYRYMYGGNYPLIFGSSKDSWTYGGLNLYCNDNRFRLDFNRNENDYYFSNQVLSNWFIPEYGYEYKFKVGQIIEDNEWTNNDGGGTKSTIYVDAWKSDRNTTENPQLNQNGILGRSDYACESFDNSSTTYSLFNSTLPSDGSNPLLTQDGTMGGSTYAATASHENQPAWWAFDGDTTTGDRCWWTFHGQATVSNPCWITFYTPNAISPTGMYILNEHASPENFKSAYIQGSTDNQNWTTLYTITNRPNTTAYGYKYEFTTENTYNYIRLYIYDGYGTSGVSIQEIKIYGFSKGFEPTQVPSIENPIWVTYYTPTAIKPRSFTIKNDDSFNNMKNGTILGSNDNSTWNTLYTITNRPQTKNLTETYFIDTKNKYKYFKLNITERYSDYKELSRNNFMVNNTQLQATMVSDFFDQCLFGDNYNGIAKFEYTSDGWKLNDNSVTIAKYLNIPGLTATSNITESPSKVYTGFSNSDYIKLSNYMNVSSGDTWEVVIKAKSDNMSKSNQHFITFGNQDQCGFLGRLDSGRLQLYAAINGRNWNIGGNVGSTTFSSNTWYLFRWRFDGSYYYVDYSSDDGTTWNNEITVQNSGTVYTSSMPIYLGYRYNFTNEYLDGYIDLNSTYIKVNGNYIFNGATLITPTIGDTIIVNYSTKYNTISTTSTNIKKFIIDGFPFTYTGDYTRLYTNIRDAKQYNIIDGELVENANYVEKKNPTVKVPLAFLNSSLEQSTHYSLGHIDLNETKCYINNSLYWEAVHTPEINEEVILNRGYGLTNNEWTVNNIIDEFNGDTSCKAKVVSINNNYAIVLPSYYYQNSVTINSNENDSVIYNVFELPTKSLIFNVINNSTDLDDAIIKLDTYKNDLRGTKLVDGYRNIYIENIPGQEIEFYINSQKYIINDNNPVLNIDVPIYNFETKGKTYYSYIIKENNVILDRQLYIYLPDHNVSMRVHTFKVSASNTTGCTIVYTIGSKTTTTTDGEIKCYSESVVNYTISKSGYISESGTYTVPIENLDSRVYNTVIKLEPIVILTLNSSESDSTYILECNGYIQSDNTITTKEGSMTIEGGNLQEINFVNNGATLTEEN